MTAEIFLTQGRSSRPRGTTRPWRRGGLRPNLKSNEEALVLITRPSKALRTRRDCSIAIDAAASSFFTGEVTSSPRRKSQPDPPARWSILRGAGEKISDRLYRGRLPKMTGMAGSSSRIHWGAKVQIVGDDLFVTNRKRLEEASILVWPTPS